MNQKRREVMMKPLFTMGTLFSQGKGTRFSSVDSLKAALARAEKSLVVR